MTKPNPPIDWEATMKTTEANARIAAKMTERAVAALAETLDHLRHHGQQLKRLEATMEEVKAQSMRPAPQLRHSLPPTQSLRRFHPLPVIIAFLAGAALAAFIVNW